MPVFLSFGAGDGNRTRITKKQRFIQLKLNKISNNAIIITKGGILMEKYQVVKFVDDDFTLDVRADADNETVWLTQEEMALLFDTDRTRITRHIAGIYKEGELEQKSTCAESALCSSIC